MRRPLGLILVVATAALVAAPAASAATSKLYRVSLSAKSTAEVTKSREVPPTSERCTGTVTETRRLTSSFGVSPVRTRALPADRRYGWLHFKARITSPRYTYRLDTSGDWGIDLGEDPEAYPRQPGECEFTHEHTTLECSWFAPARRRRGAWFMLIPVDGRYNVIINLISTSMLNCQRNESLQLIDHGPPRTKLRTAAVKRLAPGGRVKVSGTMVVSLDYDDDLDDYEEHHRGQERIRYEMTVTRVR